MFLHVTPALRTLGELPLFVTFTAELFDPLEHHPYIICNGIITVRQIQHTLPRPPLEHPMSPSFLPFLNWHAHCETKAPRDPYKDAFVTPFT